ncbi:MAG: type II toxin-antitoxin system ParD family antitoxin [Planctomycetes bacterium]|nr:type II toxin-antitoxin system ParD family antitoxin [Planctomycetota bacterium]
MNVSVPPALDDFVKAQVASGRFRTASEVVREGLCLLQDAEQRRLIEKWLVEGLTVSEESSLPPELFERAKTHVKSLIDRGLAEVRAGLLLDGSDTMRKLRDGLISRQRDSTAIESGGCGERTRQAIGRRTLDLHIDHPTDERRVTGQGQHQVVRGARH